MKHATRKSLYALFLIALINISTLAFAKLQEIEPISPEDAFMSQKEEKLIPRKRIHAEMCESKRTFPVGDLFWPLIADPKQPQFFVSMRRYNTPDTNANAAAVGYGETFGIYRKTKGESCNGLQLNISGALLAQFNLDAPSNDLVNADYIIGFPLTYRRNETSMRLRIYHQSSHLGDEFLLQNCSQRINLSFESCEALLSYQWRRWRIYGGGEYLFHREPTDLKPGGLHSGLEYYRSADRSFAFPLVVGLDVKSWGENDWSIDTSLMVGIEIGAVGPGQRRLRLMAEWYKGYAPHGQFYNDMIVYYGLGIYLGF